MADRRLDRDHGLRGPADDPAHQGHAGARSSGSGCSSPAWASARRSRSPRSSSRTRCRSAQLGVATSNLTFFRQIGGTIALAFVGTIFATSFQDQLVPQMTAAGRAAAGHRRVHPGERQRLVRLQLPDRRRRPRRGDPGRHPGRSSRRSSSRSSAHMVEGVHGAFSLATAQTFWLGVVGSVVALVAALAIKEIPLRTTNEAAGPDPGDRRQAAAPPSASPSRRRRAVAARLTARPDPSSYTRRPRWTPPGPSFVPGLAMR